MSSPRLTKLVRWPAARLPPPLDGARRVRELGVRDVLGLLRTGLVRFVVVDIGDVLRQVDEQACYDFWKAVARSHLLEPDARPRLEDLAGEYGYVASEWSDGGTPIVVLFRRH